MSTAHWYLFAYDVRDAKRLRQTAKILEGYGERVQFSVFRVHLTEDRFQKLNWELAKVLDAEDDLLVIPLCNSCAKKIEWRSKEDKNWGESPPSFELF